MKKLLLSFLFGPIPELLLSTIVARLPRVESRSPVAHTILRKRKHTLGAECTGQGRSIKSRVFSPFYNGATVSLGLGLAREIAHSRTGARSVGAHTFPPHQQWLLAGGV